MPVLQLLGPDAAAPANLLESLCARISEILSLPKERVWAYWVPIYSGNLWRPGITPIFAPVEQLVQGLEGEEMTADNRGRRVSLSFSDQQWIPFLVWQALEYVSMILNT